MSVEAVSRRVELRVGRAWQPIVFFYFSQPVNSKRNRGSRARNSKTPNQMRILKVVQAYFPFQDRGGPVVKVRALARGLARRGHRVTVLTADLGWSGQNGRGVAAGDAGAKAEPSRWGWRGEEDGVEAAYLRTMGHYRALTFNPGIVSYCSASLQQFDVVHIYGLYDLLGPTVAFFCRHRKIPYVVEPMGMHRPIVRSIRLKQMYHNLLGGHLIRGAGCLVATSEQEKQEMIARGLDAARIALRRNGIEVPEKIPGRGEFRDRLGISPEVKLVLFLGRLVAKKSPDLLIEAFARRQRRGNGGGKDVLVLAGPDERDGFLERLKEMANRSGLEEQILFPGPLYDDAKWSAYRDADVFVLPSQNENFGNTAAEAAACGTPVIVTDRCGIAPYVGACGRVIGYDAGELEEALQKMLTDSGFAERCRAGREDLARRLSWEEPLDVMEGIYNQSVAERPAG